MVGRPIEDICGSRMREPRPVLLDARGLVGPGLPEPVDLGVRRGEVVGCFCPAGAGRTERCARLAAA